MSKVLTKADIDLLKEIKTHLETEGSRNDLAAGLQTLLASMEPDPHKKPRAKPCKKVVDLLMDIDNEICDQQGAPHGRNSDRQAQRKAYTNYMTLASARIREQLTSIDVTSKVTDILEDENYHDILLAVDIAFGRKTVEQVVNMFPFV